jgi:multidrug efflux pump subunit AcrA (membrane-fusion protein)/YHS domain-containing protein
MLTPAKATVSIFIAAGIFLAGYMANRQPAPVATSASTRQVLYYACPMHPQYKSDRPGDAPCCGMRLEPVYAGSEPDRKGAVEIGVRQQQLIGVRTDQVRRAPASHLLRVPGRIAVDDDRSSRIIAAADGWIREMGQNPAGTFVKKDQILASYYAQNFQAAQQTLLFAMSNTDQLTRGVAVVASQRTPVPLNLQIAIDTLRGLGMSDLQIDEIQRTHQFASEIHIYSPVAGFVLARNISPGQRFDKGTEMYRIADIGHVWVMTDIFEKDAGFLKPGAMAMVHYQGRDFPARMSDALPQLDPQTRTLKTRFELDNPGNVLRPDVFVDVELEVRLPAALTVPPDAVIDTGRRKTVFVDRGNGFFEPRAVETGWRLGDRVEITRGLEPGERIVVSGNFLIDSESRMRLTPVSAGSMAEKTAAEKDPVCGMDVDPKDPKAIRTEHGGKTYYFCSDHCKRSFEADPGKYVPKQKKAGRQPAHDAQGVRAPA